MVDVWSINEMLYVKKCVVENDVVVLFNVGMEK